MLRRLFIALFSLLALTPGAAAQVVTLDVGDKAPAFGDKLRWLQGEPVTEFEEGHVYVLDFWAPWCTPCIQMMPHMAQLAEKYKDDDVHMIGISIFPREGMTPTDEWVEKNGSQFPYAFAEDPTEAIEEAYMVAANLYRIPTVMVVDREGVIAYVGSPYGVFDERLDRIVSGEFNASNARRAKELLAKAEELAADGDWETSLSMIDDVIALDSSSFGQYAVSKYQILLLNAEAKANHPSEDAAAYGRRVIREQIGKNVEALDYLAWFITMNQRVPANERDLELALKAASKANKVSGGKNVSVLETLAAVYNAQDEMDKAISYLERAIALAEEQEEDEDLLETLNETLANYKARQSD